MNRENALIILKRRLAFTKINCDATKLIAVQGDDKGLIYYLENGWTKLSEISNEGKEHCINVCAPGEFMGLTTLFKDETFPVNVTAITSCRLLAVNKSSLESFFLQHPQIMAVFWADLGNKVTKLRRLRIAANQQDAYRQVRDLLIQFANNYGTNIPNGRLIPFNLTQQDIADFVGLSRPRVSICLKGLLELGHIHRQGRYYVLPYSTPGPASNTKIVLNPMFSVKNF